MCTVIVLARPGHAWPLLLAANRDEMVNRAWEPPAAHWPDHPDITAGRDLTGNGTWLGLNRNGVVAAVLNRAGSLGPQPGKLSRGGLPLLALQHATAKAAADALRELNAADYRSFNMVIADATAAWFLRGLGSGEVDAEHLEPGLHMVTAKDPDDQSSPRVKRHMPRLLAAVPPSPPDDWSTWQTILADRTGPVESQINVTPHGGFGTVCASLIALKDRGPPHWLFAAGAPHETGFRPV